MRSRSMVLHRGHPAFEPGWLALRTGHQAHTGRKRTLPLYYFVPMKQCGGLRPRLIHPTILNMIDMQSTIARNRD